VHHGNITTTKNTNKITTRNKIKSHNTNTNISKRFIVWPPALPNIITSNNTNNTNNQNNINNNARRRFIVGPQHFQIS